MAAIALLAYATPAWAAFPAVESQIDGDATGTHPDVVIVMPATVSPGALLVACVVGDTNHTAYAWPGSWVEILDNDQSAHTATCAYLIAAGTEDGASVTLTATGTADSAVYFAYSITPWHGTTAPEVSTISSASTANPDPPSLNPTNWDVEDTLWIAVATAANPVGVTDYPDGYTGSQTHEAGPAGKTAIASGTKNNAAASDDPNTFTFDASGSTMAFAIAVRPAAAAAATCKGAMMMMGMGGC